MELSHADDITIISPSIRGLNKMLSIYMLNLLILSVLLSIVLSLCQLNLVTN